MSTVTVARPDVTTEEVADALRRGLAPKYNVLPGAGINWNPVGNVRANSEATTPHVSPGGLSLTSRLTNRSGIERKLLQVLHDAPNLR